MTPFEQLKILYNQLFNLSMEIKKHINEEDFDEATSKIIQKEELLDKIIATRKFIKLTNEDAFELKELENKISELERSNIDILSEMKNNVLIELNKFSKQEKINIAYDNTEESNGNILDFSE